jgi:hypothetical protein
MTVCLPTTEMISIDAMASVDTVAWWCRLCDHHGTATTRPTAHSEGVKHLTAEHHATIRHHPLISSGRPPVDLHDLVHQNRHSEPPARGKRPGKQPSN